MFYAWLLLGLGIQTEYGLTLLVVCVDVEAYFYFGDEEIVVSYTGKKAPLLELLQIAL